MRVGDRVAALEQVAEGNFASAELHIHAEAGEAGTVEYLESDPRAAGIMVRWDRSGTACGCCLSELRAIEQEPG